MATLEERVAELTAAVEGLEPWREEATRRFTAVEEQVAAGGKRLADIESNVEPVLERLAEFNRLAGAIQEELTKAFQQIGAVVRQVQDLDTRVQSIARVARPGRSVVRDAVATLQAEVAELKAAAEPAPEEETRETDKLA